MRFHDVVEHKRSRIEKRHRTDGKECYKEILFYLFFETEIEKIAHNDYGSYELHPHNIEPDNKLREE